MKTKLFFSTFLFFACFSTKAQWVQQYNGFPSFVHSDYIYVVNPNVAWATVNQSGQFTHTIDGNTWIGDTISIPATNLKISNICPANGDTAWVCMYDPAGGGAIVKTVDGGLNWVRQAAASVYMSAASYPDAIYFWNDTDGVCIGDPVLGTYEIYTTIDGGTTWNPVLSANIPSALANEYGTSCMYSVIGNTIWFATTNGRIYKSTDKGYTWNVYSTANNAFFSRRIKFLDANYGIITNTQSAHVTSAYYTTDGGLTWNVLNHTGDFFGTDFDAVPGTPGTFVSAGWLTGGIGSSFSDDGGVTWFPLDLSYPFTAIDFIDNQTGFAGNSVSTQGISKYTGMPLHVSEAKDTGSIQVYPNPVRTTANITFRMNEKNSVTLKIFDAFGKEAASSVHAVYETGIHHVSWDVSNLPGGIYFCQLMTGNFSDTQKIMIMK